MTHAPAKSLPDAENFYGVGLALALDDEGLACPHVECHSTRLDVNDDGGYACRGCGKSGTAVEAALAARPDLTDVGAYFLAEKYGLNPPAEEWPVPEVPRYEVSRAWRPNPDRDAHREGEPPSRDGHREGEPPSRDAHQPIRFSDLGALLDGGLEPPEQLVDGLIVDEQVHWLSGHPANGKTTVALWSALEYVRADGHVIWLDWEAGERDTLLRLQALGAGREEIVERFHYTYAPRITADANGLTMIKDAVRAWPKSLVVFDSASKALSTAGLDENNPAEATKWTTEVVMPLREVGATVLVIDHVVKGASRTMPYARGAGSKLADTEVAWYVEAETPFNRSQVGELRLTKNKDRSGVLPTEIRLRVGDGVGNLPVERLSGGGGEGTGRHEMRQKIIDLLRRHDGGDLTTGQVKEMVSGRAQKIVDALKELANDPLEPVKARPVGSAVKYKFDLEAVPQIVRDLYTG